MRILIVEDNEISASIMDSNLRQRNFDTVVAHTGSEALQILGAHWDIGLVIADIMLPEVDGLELVRRMRDNPKWRDIPVIVCSSLADAEHVAKAAQLGCRHYLLKPVERVKLLQLVDKILSGEKAVPILGDKKQIAAKYGLSQEALGQIMNAFAQLVNENLSALAPDEAGGADSAAPVNVARLAEGAVALGATRLLTLLQAIQARGNNTVPTPDERDLLFRELKLVERALSSQFKAEPPPEATGHLHSTQQAPA
jgi:CheY-like chemotaxis protein